MAILTLAVFTLISALQSTTSGQTCTLGRPQLPQSTTNPTPGLFIQEEGAAPCDGFITQWRVCYYNPSLTSRSSQFQILLEVWRDNELDNSLVSVGNLFAFITVPDQPASFQCTDVAHPPNRPIAVREGDHLGVYIPSVDSVLPIINSGAAGGGTVYFALVSDQIPFRVNRPNGREPRVTQLSDHAIHLSATVESTNFTTMNSMSSTTTETSTQDLSTTTNQLTTPTSLPGADIPSNNNSNKIITIIIAISAPAVLLLVVLIIIIAAVKMKSKAKQPINKDAETHDIPYNILSINRHNDAAPALNNVMVDSTIETDAHMSNNVCYGVQLAHIDSEILYDYPMNIPCQANLSYKSEF